MQILNLTSHNIFKSYNALTAKTFLLEEPYKVIEKLQKDSSSYNMKYGLSIFYHQKKISKTEVLRVTDINNDINLIKERYVYFKN
jgi:hypothetical protein